MSDTIKSLKQALRFLEAIEAKDATTQQKDPSGMIGQFVVVRCRDAGVHAGYLENRTGRECLLSAARRLWYWKPKKGKWLSSVAKHGLDESSKVGEPVTAYLTENCEILQCSADAEKSINEVISNG